LFLAANSRTPLGFIRPPKTKIGAPIYRAKLQEADVSVKGGGIVYQQIFLAAKRTSADALGLEAWSKELDSLQWRGGPVLVKFCRRSRSRLGSDTGIRTRILALRGLRPNP
jgi:hypothetical protein